MLELVDEDWAAKVEMEVHGCFIMDDIIGIRKEDGQVVLIMSDKNV